VSKRRAWPKSAGFFGTADKASGAGGEFDVAVHGSSGRVAVIETREPAKSVVVPADTPIELVQKLQAGLSYQTIENLRVTMGLTTARVAELTRIPERTLARRRREGRLSQDESERVFRLASVFERAVELFDGDREAAKRWMETPRRTFGGKSALEFSDTEVGAQEVRDLIGRIEHGVVS
jgi:putative toxin-antitoxin system antitoxin component (TIGR02293 family)